MERSKADVFHDWLPVLIVIALIVIGLLTTGSTDEGNNSPGPFLSH